MYKGEKIALVIPAHNEERLIGPTLERAPETIDRIYVVDDASQDPPHRSGLGALRPGV